MKEISKNGAIRKLKEAIREGVEDLSTEQMILILRLNQLKEDLLNLEILKKTGLKISAENLAKKLDSYEDLIDRKYWDDYALFYIVTAITCRVADTVEEACEMYDEFKKIKK